MTITCAAILSSFTTPLRIGTEPAAMLWLLPLMASIALVYKATKVSRIRWVPFLRESFVLFGSILVFILIAAVILYGVAWIVTEELPALLGRPAF